MIFRNLHRIIKSYRLFIVKIIFFELFYFFRGFKGNKFNFSKNLTMADNIPCPYYFLKRINFFLINNEFKTFVDMGCGSGRTIDFFNRSFKSKKYLGIEYFSSNYEYCKNIFKDKNNIKIINEDFTKFDIEKYDADCYFFNCPFKNPSDIIEILNKIINLRLKKRKTIFIFVNISDKIIKLVNHIKCVDNFTINEQSNLPTQQRSYSIYSLNIQ